MDQAATSTPATTPAAPKAAEPLDLAKLTAEIAALADLAGAAASGGASLNGGAPVERGDSSVADTPSTGSGRSDGTNDFAALEREIEALLAGGASTDAPSGVREVPSATMSVPPTDASELQSVLDEHLAGEPLSVSTPSPDEPAAPDVRRDSLAEKPIDPLLREVDALLSDDAEALLANSGGDIGRAVESVFDPRALSSQEEDVNRALIDAFGSSRSTAFSFGDAAITNPAPRFEGVSKQVPPDMARADHDRAAREAAAAQLPTRSFEAIASESLARKETEYAGEKPFEPAFPALPVEATDPRVTTSAPMATKDAPSTVAAATMAAAASATAGAPSTPAAATIAPKAVASPDTTHAAAAPTVVPTEIPMATGPSAIARAFHAMGRAVVAVASLPLVICAFPMRFVPTSARGIVSVAAITTVLWVPVAWWYAAGLSKQPGVGPVALVERPAAEGEGHAAAATEQKSSGSDSASHGAAADAGHAAPAKAH